MLGFAVILILCTILFFLYTNAKNLTLFCKLFILTALIIKFISFKLDFPYASLADVFLFVLILILLLVNINNILNTKYSKTIILSQFLFLVYILTTGILRGDVFYIIDLTKFYFFGAFLFLLIISSKKKIDIYSINRFIFIFTILLSILGVMQFFIPSLSSFFVIDLTEFGYKQTKTDLDIFKRVLGVSTSTTSYGNLLAFLLCYLIAVRHKLFYKKKIFLYFGILIGFTSILLTGVRMAMGSLIIAVLLFSVLNKDKQLLKFISLLIIIIVVSWQSLLLIGKNYDSGKEGFSNPIGRTMELILFFQNNEISTRSTLSMTSESFDEFVKNPIFGTGNEMKWLQYYSITDAYLIYHLIQIGFIGIIILFFPYFKVINNNVIKILFLILILQTITDTGIFTNDINLIFWIIAAISIKKEKYIVDRKKIILQETFLINQNANK